MEVVIDLFFNEKPIYEKPVLSDVMSDVYNVFVRCSATTIQHTTLNNLNNILGKLTVISCSFLINVKAFRQSGFNISQQKKKQFQ